jgi:hypothetical protein
MKGQVGCPGLLIAVALRDVAAFRPIAGTTNLEKFARFEGPRTRWMRFVRATAIGNVVGLKVRRRSDVWVEK